MENSTIDFKGVVVEMLKSGHKIDVPVKGWSMFPCLVPGIMVRLQSINWQTVMVGDIVVFELNSTWVLHRIMKIADRQVMIKGDGRITHDGWIDKNEVIAQMNGYSSKGVFFKTTSGCNKTYLQFVIRWPSLVVYVFKPIGLFLYKIKKFLSHF